MDFRNQILSNVMELESHTQKLKIMSEYYPIIKQDVFDNTIFLTTLVRIERDGKWYTVHCVESFASIDSLDFATNFETMMINVHNIQHLYKITGTMEDLDILQQSEADRLRELTKNIEK